MINWSGDPWFEHT